MLLWLKYESKLFGKMLIVLLLLALFVMTLATPATSVATGIGKTSVNTSISNSLSYKEKPQALSAATLLSNLKEAKTSSLSSSTAAAASATSSSSPLQVLESSMQLSSTPLIFMWGHTTKYSNILYDELVSIKGPIVLDVKYPEIENTNSHIIIGIQAYDYDDHHINSNYDAGNSNLQVYPVKGGIGNNSTVMRFLLTTEHELHYRLVIHGVDI